MNDITNKLIPLVKAFARDMKILIVDDQTANIEYYKARFAKYFQVCDVALNGEDAYKLWSKDRNYYDLIITDLYMPVMDGLELIKIVREHSMEQNIIVITSADDVQDTQELAYYYIDGLLPRPVDKEKLYILLYRVLKKIAEKNDLYDYLNILEKQVVENTDSKNHCKYIIEKLQPLKEHKEVQNVIAMLQALVGKKESSIQTQESVIEKKSQSIISDEQEKDLRFSTADHKLSATEFTEQLDDTIIDKIEEFRYVLDTYVDELDAIESQEPQKAIESLADISRYIDQFILIVDSLVVFPIIVRAFNNLNSFIGNIQAADIEDLERKKLLVGLLLNLEKDISKWINTIFIERSARNIYYFDASFSNAIFEIESVFNASAMEELDEEFSDEDLGFF